MIPRCHLSDILPRFIVFAAFCFCSSGRAAEPSAVYLDALADQITSNQECGALGLKTAAKLADGPAARLQIKDKQYQRGLGHHAAGEIYVPLDGQYKTFECEIGVQWQGGKSLATVVFQVYVDDQLTFDSDVMRENDPPRPVSVSLEGADMLRLVVGTAGDGTLGDRADWAEARLTPAQEPTRLRTGTPVNIAASARVVTSDPKRTRGTAAGRDKEFPAEDVFLETDVEPATDGSYTVPAAMDGQGCIGLRWCEERFLHRLELHWSAVSAVPAVNEVQLQYWAPMSGKRPQYFPWASPWQGQWQPLPAEFAQSERVWSWQVAQKVLPMGTFRVRWIFPASKVPLVLDSLSAYSRSSWTTADLHVELQRPQVGKESRINVYNGDLLGTTDKLPGATDKDPGATDKDVARTCLWDLSKPLALTVRYSTPRARKMDRTLLRCDLPEGTISVAVEDVVAHGCVYVPSAGLFMSVAPPPMTLPQYLQHIAGKETVLEQVRQRPDQSFAGAMAKTHNPIQNLGPTLVGLACDNRKFVVDRDGRIRFDLYDAPEVTYDTQRFWELVEPEQFCPQLVPQFGNGGGDISRHLDGDWLPKPVTVVVADGVKYQQCTYVAPVDEKAPDGFPSWYRRRATCVVEYTFENTRAAEADVALTLTLKDGKNATIDAIQEVKHGCVASVGDRLWAFFDGGQLSPLRLATQAHAVCVKGRLASGQSARLLVYLPAWPLRPAEHALLGDAARWAAQTNQYWKDMLAGAMQIDIPDPALLNVIRASQVNCLLTAHNLDGGRLVVPWVAGAWYGSSVESEAQSVVRAMDMFGYADIARRELEYFLTLYNAQGYLSTGYTMVGTGEHLWTLAEHQRRYGDRPWLEAVAPQLVKTCRWIGAQRAKTKGLDPCGGKSPAYGLMPPGVMADWERYAYRFFNDAQYCHGLEMVARELAAIEHPDAPALTADARQYREDVLRAYRKMQARCPVVPLGNGAWVPNHPGMLDAFGNIEEMMPAEDDARTWCYSVEIGSHHLAANGILDPASDDVARMMDYLEDYQFLRSGWFDYPEPRNRNDVFNLGGFAKMQPYYARNAEIYALRDDVKPFLRSYFNALSSLLSEENLTLWEHFHNTSAWNKTHETGWFLCQTALMFVMERDEDLWLAPMVSDRWLEDGKKIEVRNAPTRFGAVSYAIVSAAASGHITAEIQPPTRAPYKRMVIRVRHPQGRPIRAVTVNGKPHQDFDPRKECINIPPTTEHVTVRVEY